VRRNLFGIEADYYRGCETFLGKWLEVQDFDLVLGSVHFIDDWGFDDPDVKQVWNSVDIVNTWRAYFKLVEKLVDTRLFDAVSHLDIPKKFGHRPPEKDLKEMVQPVLDRVAEAGMGMELNTSGLRKPVGDFSWPGMRDIRTISGSGNEKRPWFPFLKCFFIQPEKLEC